MKRTSKALFLAICILASGCTTTLVSNSTVDKEGKQNAIHPGVIYSLPVTGFEISAKFRVISCAKNGDIYELDYEVIAPELVQRFVSDRKETYVIDYQKLNDTFKATTANFAMYPNGMLKSLNASVDDRTAQVVASLGGAAVNLAKAVAVGGFVPFSPDKALACPPFVNKKIESYDGLADALRKAAAADKELEAKRQALDKAKGEAEKAEAALAAAPKDSKPDDLAKLKAAVASTKKTVEKLTAELKGKEPATPAAQKKLQKVTQQVTSSSRAFWIPGMDKKYCESLSVNAQEAARKMFDPGELSEADAKVFNDFVANVSSKAVFRTSFCVEKRFENTAATNSSTEIPVGLVYRIPELGLLEVRKQKSSNPRESSPISYSENVLSFPQFGVKAVLSLQNQMFDKNTLKVSFQEDGSLSTLDFTTESQAERAAASVQDITKLYGEYLTSLQQSRLKLEQDKDAATALERTRRISDLDAKIAEIKKLQEVEIARSGIQDRLDLQKNVTIKQRELIEEQTKLEKARREQDALKNQ